MSVYLYKCYPFDLVLLRFTKGIFITKADLLFFLEDFPKNLFLIPPSKPLAQTHIDSRSNHGQ